jgi:hypothetical protein
MGVAMGKEEPMSLEAAEIDFENVALPPSLKVLSVKVVLSGTIFVKVLLVNTPISNAQGYECALWTLWFLDETLFLRSRCSTVT